MHQSAPTGTPSAATTYANNTMSLNIASAVGDLVISVVSVSYTHLDVYKRQVIACYYCQPS